MSATNSKSRPVWQDRFRAPSPDELVDAFNKQTGSLIQHTRERLRAGEGVKEELSLQGVWNWTFVFRVPNDSPLGWAYLVPDPAKPRVAVPVPDDIITELPIRKLSKFIRDGLVHAPRVDGIRWATWDLLNKTQAGDIVALADLSLRLTRIER